MLVIDLSVIHDHEDDEYQYESHVRHQGAGQTKHHAALSL